MIPTVTVTGTYEDAEGDPATGTVTFKLNTAITDGDTIVDRSPVVATLSAGAFSQVLAATSGPDIEPVEGVVYTVTEQITGSRTRRYRVALPHTSPTVDLADLAPADDTGLVWTEHITQADLTAVDDAQEASRRISREIGQPRPCFDDSGAWTATSATLAAVDGPHGVALSVTMTASTTGTIERAFPVSLTDGRFLSFWIKPDANFNTLDFRLVADGWSDTASRWDRSSYIGGEASGSAGGIYPAGEWRRVSASIAALTAAGTTPPTAGDDIRMLRLNVRAGAGGASTILFADMRVHDAPEPGSVWAFDDAHSNVYDVVFPLMEAAGLVGVVYVPTAKVGTAGYATLGQLQEMHAAGWQMASHTENEVDLTAQTLTVLRNELKNSIEYLVDTLGASPDEARHIAYVGGVHNDREVKEVLRHMRTGRSIYNSGGLGYITPYVGSLGSLRTTYVTESMPLATLTGHMDRLIQYGGQSIISFHEIRAAATGVHWAQADFEAAIEHAVDVGLQNYLLTDLFP